jgi:small subunit ribosomal protein S16
MHANTKEDSLVVIRLARAGGKNKPFFHVVVADSRRARDGRFIELLGHYNPIARPAEIRIDREKVKAWITKGARPSETVRVLLKKPDTEVRAPKEKFLWTPPPRPERVSATEEAAGEGPRRTMRGGRGRPGERGDRRDRGERGGEQRPGHIPRRAAMTAKAVHSASPTDESTPQTEAAADAHVAQAAEKAHAERVHAEKAHASGEKAAPKKPAQPRKPAAPKPDDAPKAE